MAMSKRRQMVLRTISCWYCGSLRSKVTPPPQLHRRGGNDFVHLLGREFAVSSAISSTRLASRGFRMLFSRAPGEGGGLSFVSPLSFFQLTFQVVNFFFQPLSFTLQPLSFPLPLFAL